MWTLVNKVVFGLFLASHVASLPYIEHLEGHQGYHKNASGHSILDRKLVNTKGGHVIPPTAVSTTGLTATPTTTTDNNEHATSSDIAARSQDEPPTIAVMRIFLRVNNPNWDGNNCVFWDDATFTNEDEIENICKNSLSNRLPGHWFKWLYYEKPTTAFPQGRHMAHVWGRPGFPTNHFPADESLRDNDPQVMQRMMQALAETCVGPVWLLIERNGVPGAQSQWSRDVEPELNRRQVDVRAYDPDMYSLWRVNLLGVNLDNYQRPD